MIDFEMRKFGWSEYIKFVVYIRVYILGYWSVEYLFLGISGENGKLCKMSLVFIRLIERNNYRLSIVLVNV